MNKAFQKDFDQIVNYNEKPKISSLKEDIDKIYKLISELLSGSITPTDFRIAIQKYNVTKVVSLFRDSFPKFPASYKIKLTDTFSRYFYNANLSPNQFWLFVNNNKFWTEIKMFHDVYYDRSVRFNNFIEYLRAVLMEFRLGEYLSPVEKTLIQILQANPYQSFKDISEKTGISQKSITQALQKLKSKKIYFGSLVSYNAVGFKEYFIELESLDKPTYHDKFIYLEENSQFPKKEKLYFGITKEKISSINSFEVLTKTYSINLSLIEEPYSLKWALSQNRPKLLPQTVTSIKSTSNMAHIVTKPHTIMLLRRSEKDFKRPGYTNISKLCGVSVRTLLREKNTLINNGIIKPCLYTNSDALIYLFVKSKAELAKLYSYVPIINSFKVSDLHNQIFWISKIGIIPKDLSTILDYLKGWTETTIISNRHIIIDKTLDID